MYPSNQDFHIEGHTSICHLKKQELYQDAKNGDLSAAREVVRACAKRERLQSFREAFSNCTLLPVLSVNQLPLALALEIGLPVIAGAQVRYSKERKYMSAMERLINTPEFTGSLKPGRYILIDDVLTQGGVLNSLRQFVCEHGGEPVAAMVLAFAAGSRPLVPSDDKIQFLHRKFGQELADVLSGIGLSCDLHRLTNSQVRYLLQFSEPGKILERALKCG